MKLKIEVWCDNDAFQGESGAEEVRRLLRELAARIEYMADEEDLPSEPITLWDRNGNRAGYATFTRG